MARWAPFFRKSLQDFATSGCRRTPVASPSCLALLIVQDEREQHVHLVLDDGALVETHLLFFDPGAADIANRLVRAHCSQGACPSAGERELDRHAHLHLHRLAVEQGRLE